MSSNVVFPVFVTTIVYSITSSGLTFVVSVISVNPSASFAFTAVASLFTNIHGFCSTSTSLSGDLSPTVATLWIFPPLSISSCFTVYVPVTLADFPTSIVSIFVSIPAISSLTVISVNVVFPVFFTVIVYVIISPAAVTFSLSAVFTAV